MATKETVSKKHNEYIDLVRKYLNGLASEEEVDKAGEDYLNELNNLIEESQ